MPEVLDRNDAASEFGDMAAMMLWRPESIGRSFTLRNRRGKRIPVTMTPDGLILSRTNPVTKEDVEYAITGLKRAWQQSDQPPNSLSDTYQEKVRHRINDAELHLGWGELEESLNAVAEGWELLHEGSNAEENPSESDKEKCRRILAEEDSGRLQPFRRVNMSRRNPQTGMTSKGRRMYEHVKKSGSSYAPSAVVYGAAKKHRGTGLVTKSWAKKHGYPIPNLDIEDMRKKNAEEDIVIQYGVVPNEYKTKGGWLPVIWVNGKQYGSTYSDFTYDREDALIAAKERAEEEASRYTGDWNIMVYQKEERSNPDDEIDEGEILDELIELAGNSRNFSEKKAESLASMIFDYASGDIVEDERYGRIVEMTPSDILRKVDKFADTHGVEAIYEGDDGLLSTRGGRLVAEYLNSGDTYNLTLLYDYDDESFSFTTYGDWVEEWEKEKFADTMEIRLDNLSRDHQLGGTALITMRGPYAAAKAERDQSIAGSHWETDDDDFAYAIVVDHPDLVDELENDGYDVNTDDYSPPD